MQLASTNRRKPCIAAPSVSSPVALQRGSLCFRSASQTGIAPRQAPRQLLRCSAAQQQVQRPPVCWQTDLEATEVEALRAVEQAVSGPILSGAGGGLFFWWELGERRPSSPVLIACEA